MIRAKEIQDKLLHLVGWEQSTFRQVGATIDESLTESESGLYFQQVHPLLTLDNLYSIAPDFSNIQGQYYSDLVEYKAGDVVKWEDDTFYRAKVDTPDEEPSEISDAWEKVNLFSEWLEGKTRSGISKTINRYINDKLKKGTHNSLCENRTLFAGAGRMHDAQPNKGEIVGFEIVPIRSKGVTVKIERIALQFTKAGKYRLYVMQSGSYEPYRIIDLEKQKDNTVEWFTFKDLYLPYRSDTTEAGGSWFICYQQREIPEDSKAIIKNRDWSKEPCKSCSIVEYLDWQAWSKYIEVHPFKIGGPNSRGSYNGAYDNDYGTDDRAAAHNEGVNMWDIAKVEHTYDTNYGLNLEVTVACDITDFIIEQKELFQDVIMKQVGVDLLRELAFNANARTNRNSLNCSKMDILFELEGDSSSMKKSGLSYQLEEAYKAIEMSTEGIDRICMPCNNHGVKYRTV